MDVSVNNTAPVYEVADISQMDLESALMAVQGERAQLLESRLMEQMQKVQEKNSQIQQLNVLKNELGAISAKSTDPNYAFSADEKALLLGLRQPGTIEGLSPEQIDAYKQEYLADNPASAAEASGCFVQFTKDVSLYNMWGPDLKISKNVTSAEMDKVVEALDAQWGSVQQYQLTAIGITPEMVQAHRDGKAPGYERLEAADEYAYAKNDEAIAAGNNYSSNEAPIKGITKMVNGVVVLDVANKGELDKVIANIGTQIDGLTNSQQMDMLNLQSLSNKRNEAYEIMTNFMKKMADSRSSIIGNMR